MTRHRLTADFEDLDGHRTLAVCRFPPVAPRAHVLFVPAFGDEMNQTRRMVRLTAEALVERGVGSTAFDLHGTGDSSAGFEEATVERWLDDCRRMVASAQRESDAPLILAGCRLGVALAVVASHSLEHRVRALVGWAPLLQGRLQLSSLLRAAALGRGAPGNQVRDPKASWAVGEIAMLAGYPVSAALAEQLQALDATGAPAAESATLLDVRLAVGDDAVAPSPALLAHAQRWNDAGVATRVEAIAGPAFWNVADLVDVPALVDATVSAVEHALGRDLARVAT